VWARHERHRGGTNGEAGALLYDGFVSRTRAACIIFVIATFAGLYFAVQAHFNPYLLAPIRHALLVNLTYYWLWALVTPIIIAAARRFRTWPRAIAAHVLFSVVLTGLHTVVAELILKLPDTRMEPFWSLIGFTFLVNFQSSLPTYWLILFVYLSFDYYAKYRARELRSAQLAAELSRAQLQALKMQLKPHFLFNTLHSISSLMDSDVEAADRMLVRLSEFLRLTLDRELDQEVPLEQELEFVRRYLEIEQVRFEERLRVSFDVEEDTAAALVPALALQPLIENAIHHGIGSRPEGGSIAIRARRENGNLHIRVADDGVGAAGAGEPRERVGLANTRARIERLYGDAQRMTFASMAATGTVVDIVIPYRTERA
jgi:hypothetical protein